MTSNRRNFLILGGASLALAGCGGDLLGPPPAPPIYVLEAPAPVAAMAQLPWSLSVMRPNAPSFYLAWGTEDDIVDQPTQAVPFRDALKQAGYYVRTVVIPGAPHFWSSDPIDEPNSYPGIAAPRILRFLQEKL